MENQNLKIGFVCIIIKGDRNTADKVQTILSDNSSIIVGRMGIPDITKNINMISVGVKGTNEQISALTGRLGRLNFVKVKTAVVDAD